MSNQAPVSSNASRYLFLFLIGLFMGAICVVMLLRALEARKTWRDRYPYATMHLLEVHLVQLNAARTANRCLATDAFPHVQALRMLANDLEPAFPALRDDARFIQHTGQLREVLDVAMTSMPQGCAAIEQLTSDIGQACKACHQDFRN